MKGWMTRRQRIARKIADDDIADHEEARGRIMAAALQAMLHKGLIQQGPQGPEINKKIAALIGTLDTDQLLKLRRIAEGLEVGAEH